MKGIAIAVPTYGRPEIINSLLNNCAEIYETFNVDIHIFDSSKDESTREIIRNWKRSNNVYQYRLPEKMHANVKVYKIFEFFVDKGYDYVWLCGDGIQFSKAILKKICDSVIEDDFDVIHINNRDLENIGEKVFLDKNDFFEQCAWSATMFGAIILNSKTMIQPVNWEEYEDKYLSEDIISFSHISFYFSRLSECNAIKILHLPIIGQKTCPLKTKSGWYNDVFEVFVKQWYNTIMNLPDCYENKVDAIIKHGQYGTFRSENYFIEYRKRNIYNLEVYYKYENLWDKVCTLDKQTLKRIAEMKVDEVNEAFQKKKSEFLSFIQNSKQIYVYGAGGIGTVFGDYISKVLKRPIIYIVTSNDFEMKENNGNRIMEYKDILPFSEGCKVVLALNKKNLSEVLNTIGHDISRDNIFYDEDLFPILKSELVEMSSAFN